jgi:glutathione peroxidase-family protein
LVDGEGRAVKSFGHRVSPSEMEVDIARMLEENERGRQVPVTQ